MERKIVTCLNCGEVFEFTNASNDEMGWHTSCPKCEGSFDIDIEKYLIPNGTIVKYSCTKFGVIDGNDSETSEEFKNINYYVCPIEETYKAVWSNDYVMLRRDEFSLLRVSKERIKFVIANRRIFDKTKYDFVSQLQHEFAGEKEVLSFVNLNNALHFDSMEKAVKTYMEQPLWVRERCTVIPFDKTEYGECYML